ncbi:MAG TPA: hypothetical protein VEL74_14400 [Thermoanaerobaculia bacterium]|nr:hypothetical protein [Thermoanaerobaculia bacterium]
MKNRRSPEQPEHHEAPSVMKGHDFEPEEKSSGAKPDEPATAYTGPHAPPPRGGKQS